MSIKRISGSPRTGSRAGTLYKPYLHLLILIPHPRELRHCQSALDLNSYCFSEKPKVFENENIWKIMSNKTEPLSPEFIAAYRGNELVAVSIAFIPIILIAVCLRFYCRSLSKSGWGSDDYLVVCRYVVALISKTKNSLYEQKRSP